MPIPPAANFPVTGIPTNYESGTVSTPAISNGRCITATVNALPVRTSQNNCITYKKCCTGAACSLFVLAGFISLYFSLPDRKQNGMSEKDILLFLLSIVSFAGALVINPLCIKDSASVPEDDHQLVIQTELSHPGAEINNGLPSYHNIVDVNIQPPTYSQHIDSRGLENITHI